MYTRSPHYLYQRNGVYYFTRQVPSDLKTKFNKNRVVISLRTSSKQKAIESANKLTDRLETYWNTLRLELFHTKELKLSFLDNQKSKKETVKLSKALDTYIKLKGNGKGELFHRTALLYDTTNVDDRNIPLTKNACLLYTSDACRRRG